MLFEDVDETAASFRHTGVFAANDFASLHRVTVDVGTGVIIRANRGAFEGYSGKYSARARIAEDLGAHPGVGIRGSIASLWSGCNGSVAAQLNLAAEDGIHAAAIHDEKNQVRSFSADLEADAGAFKSVHRRCSPGSAEMFAGAANHRAAAVVRADSESQLFDARDYDDTLGLVQ